ncbi:pyruvate dehydrogenase E2 component (dihydrolipoamide acetyltransferase) [Branchiibius hedensis]|uniref:Dihydrolipoamide acetyltransferase component of pyruvate dehydrogenase complex n=1 Tax=Branchiibius hedensis TaxID=672460 RepID=A0A2Y9BUQ4_9MICO|nr:dihydrolipoamide acetyltransferase family protein [Branchiibius hedensis]PWJ27301.1 pyruvate dehydrogenase E2 component (dihydrolipoamide acetyltransferase) [Branchiibius hedensis]SSA36112.1 pyruvate dehydrogenase E2 component (dihydrolipoamide acetyltransferase) [Branchiibius hedensis]
MSIQQFTLPDPGEGLPDAEIATWKVQVGDTVKVNDVVVEIETAKSLVELPIPWEGTITQLLVAEGDTVDVGTPIIAVEVNDGVVSEDPGPATPAAAPEPAVVSEQVAAAFEPDPPTTAVEDGSGPNLVGYGAPAAATARRPRATPDFRSATHASAAPAGEVRFKSGGESAAGPVLAKPATRGLAKEHGIDLHDVPASGEGGIVTDEDVRALIGGPARGTVTPTTAPAGERETRVPVKGVRKVTAEAMVTSAFTAPHVTEFVTVDATATMELVDRLSSDREFQGVRVSPLLVIAKALCIAVRRNPGMNAFWDEAAQEIVTKHYVNLGIAAATPRGLIVPNIKDADRMTMRELGAALGELVDTARAGKTQPRDQAGGTITITNVGVFGIDSGTPIINPGESAIVCLGAIRRMPWVVTGDDGTERIEPRWVTQLGCSFDHRLIDGELGSKFLADLAALVQDPGKALVWG